MVEALMQLTARQHLAQFAHLLQRSLFPVIEEETGALTAPAKLLTSVLAMAQIQPRLQHRGGIGRPPEDRIALAAAFVAKAVYQMPTTRQLLHRLRTGGQLRRICGWDLARSVPHESTFSRAFHEFAQSELPQRLHAALIEATQRNRLIGHISRDSTAIEARERFAKAPKPAAAPKPAKAVKKAKSKAKKQKANQHKPCKAAGRGTQIERQRYMTLDRMIAGLPMQCAIGVKTSSKGHQQYWRGYKLHLDVAGGQIPISAIVTGANAHDATVAIP